RSFKLFVGIVLLYIGGRMVYQSILNGSFAGSSVKTAEARLRQDISRSRDLTRTSRYREPAIRTVSWSLRRTEYEFYGERFSFHTTGLFLLSLLVGLVGGVYGVGGGAIIAPFIVSFFGLPVHTIAGATLMGTCVTSVGGVIFYSLASVYHLRPELTVAPDWLLGFLFGVGGLVGMYLGATAQKYVSTAIITPVIAFLVTGLGLKYVDGYIV
ncbi:MAG: sulfite exporter TauE/SafE family protein, partial [Deltaproteobacteria bacterium]